MNVFHIDYARRAGKRAWLDAYTLGQDIGTWAGVAIIALFMLGVLWIASGQPDEFEIRCPAHTGDQTGAHGAVIDHNQC